MANLSTTVLSPDATGIFRAAETLSAGGLVALPTETVYGLGADARNDRAVARIFQAKGRPHFNPLIVHVASAQVAQRYVEWSASAQILSETFWPGALTLVLPLRADAGLSPLVTAELPTLAIRVPAHAVAQQLLAAFDGPVAAPSANPSGKISPTTAQHVIDGLSGRIEAILDGGPCPVGVESTIIGLSDVGQSDVGQSAPPTLLRPGGVAAEDIEAALGVRLAQRDQADPLTAPGQMLSHYAPGARVRLNAHDTCDQELLLGFGPVDCALNLSETGDLVEAAANLFHHLHALDAMNPAGIAVSPIPMRGLGLAINDRLARAAAPRP
ncbi:L-threonylcarbamoyladenylate synthase [Thalassobius sp. S69A]|uniref:L-threonylcarbamoyladenylate synthase n=1 Tax=unclassified Thalassovita TaxID=2619711 RepID=UPI003C7C7A7F